MRSGTKVMDMYTDSLKYKGHEANVVSKPVSLQDSIKQCSKNAQILKYFYLNTQALLFDELNFKNPVIDIYWPMLIQVCKMTLSFIAQRLDQYVNLKSDYIFYRGTKKVAC